MSNPDFCAFCGSLGHKMVMLKEGMYFCKECNKFFEFEKKVFRCPKCNSPNIVDSEFPSPDGGMIFHCQGCRKMFSAKELMDEGK